MWCPCLRQVGLPDAKAREAMIRSMLTPEMCAKVKYAGMLVVVCVCVMMVMLVIVAWWWSYGGGCVMQFGCVRCDSAVSR